MKDVVRELIHLEWQVGAKNEMWDSVLTDSTLFSSAMGRKIGIDCVKLHSKDFFHACPDFCTEVKKMQVFGNVVVCDAVFTATHQNFYTCTETDASGVIIQSDFCEKFAGLTPKGKKFVQVVELFFVFERGKIMRIAIQEDPLSLCRQLGIDVKVEKADERVLWKREYEFLVGKVRSTFGLGERETLCLALSFSSLSAKFVGEVLGISHRTVEAHLQGCYQKIGCQNKQQCLEAVVQRGMLSIFHEISLIILKMQND